MVLQIDGLDRPQGSIHPKLGDFEQAFDRTRDLTEPVFELLAHLTDRLDILQTANASVHIDLVPHVLDVLGG